MPISNLHSYPDIFMRVAHADNHVYDGHISVTQLVGPARMHQLIKRHDDEIVVDVSSMTWRIMGTAVHKLLSEHAAAGEYAEMRAHRTFDGCVISGQADLINNNTIQDYKVTSTHAVTMGGKPEWEAQLNVLRWIFQGAGLTRDKLQSVPIFRDYMKAKARDPEYPQSDVVVIDVPVWDDEYMFAYLTDRVCEHRDAANVSDDELPLCTKKERWARGEAWAIMKEGNKNAIRGGLCRTEEDAVELLSTLDKKHYIQYRPPAFRRCEDFCIAAQVCDQFKEGL